MSVLEHFKIKLELYDSAGERAYSNQSGDEQLTLEARKIEISEHKRIAILNENYEELDRATTIKHLDTLEMKKAAFMTGVYV